jgi:hypothetical protein
MAWSYSSKMLKIDWLCSTCQVCQMTKKAHKKYGLLPPKIAEYDTVSLGHDLCGSGGSIYNKDTSQNKLSDCTHNDRYRKVTQQNNIGWFEIVKATNKSATSIQDLFHNTWLARYSQPQFIVFVNWNMGEFKREFKQMCEMDNYGIKSKPATSHNIPSTSKCNH